MKPGLFSILVTFVLTPFLSGHVTAKEEPDRIVRLARLEIDATQLENYRVALREEIETSVRVESGVLSLKGFGE